MNEVLSAPERQKRNFVDDVFVPSTWEVIEPYFKNLEERTFKSVADLKKWLHDWSELDTILDENSRWIYVRTTVDTTDSKAKSDLENLYINISPKVSVFENLLKKKFVSTPFIAELDQHIFFTTIRKVKKEIELFREENVPLFSEMNLKQSEYDRIAGAQSIVYRGVEITMQQAAVYNKSTDRRQRQEVFELIGERKRHDSEILDRLFTELIQLRHRVAQNAGYKNYMAYRFDELGRFDYSPEDCLKFHSSVEKVLMPVVNALFEKRKKELGLEAIKPWDTEVDTSGEAPLKPFGTTAELIMKTITCFHSLDPFFARCLEIMRDRKYLDLDSRIGKAPGGYNSTMPESGLPFIFMNAANTEDDLITMVHEGGHAVHSFLSHPLELHAFKETTSETAEVASMAMELLSMEHWDIFYPEKEDLRRAKKGQLEDVLSKLPKICLGDSFQFWLYLNPDHSVEERRNKWSELQRKYTPENIDWQGYEDFLRTRYQSVLHFYIVPFYYIEYAFAQLGALAVWRNFKLNPQKAIRDYKNALSQGYTKSVPAFYETAGAKFDFSQSYISGLIDFLEVELNKL